MSFTIYTFYALCIVYVSAFSALNVDQTTAYYLYIFDPFQLINNTKCCSTRKTQINYLFTNPGSNLCQEN